MTCSFAKSVALRSVSVVMLLVAWGGCAGTRPVDETAPAQTAGPGDAESRRGVGKLVIEKGLADFQVFQRDAKDLAVIRCSGPTSLQGHVMAGVFDATNPKKAVVAFASAGEASNGHWSAEIKNVPTGGPYIVLLSLRDSSGRTFAGVATRNVLVGDLWILAGQSNMQGCGDMIDVEPPSPFVNTFESRYQWATAEEPLHRLTESPNAIHFRIMNPKMTEADMKKARSAPRKPEAKGTGLGIPFAREMYNRTHVPIGLVPCAHGGTSMDQWDPARRDEKGNSLYGAMYDRFLAVGGKVKGVLWYQGESDASAKSQPQYYEKFKSFINAVRKDLGDADLPFYLVQISRVTLPRFDENGWNGVQDDERRIALAMKNVRTVSAIDLELDDIIHIGTQGHKQLGRRLALVATHDLFGQTKVDTGPQLKSVALESPGVLRVTFEHLNGSLSPRRHIAGFSAWGPDGKPLPDFFDVVVDPKNPGTVLCQFWGELPAGSVLWYGKGCNPYCNLVDQEDLAAPVFGPVAIKMPATAPKP